MPRSYVQIKVKKNLKNLVQIERNVYNKKHEKEVRAMAREFLRLLKQALGVKRKWYQLGSRPIGKARKSLTYTVNNQKGKIRFYYYSRDPEVDLKAIQYGSKPHWERNVWGYTWKPKQYRIKNGRIEWLHRGSRPLRIVEYSITKLRKKFPYRIRRSIIQ